MPNIVLAIFFVLAPFASAKDLEILAVEESPSSYVNSNGEAAGFSIDVVRELQVRIGNNTPIQVLPEARALRKGLNEPDVLLVGFSRTPERENDFHWITLLLRKPWILYSNANNRIRLNKLDAARSLSTIGVVIGDVREQYLSYKGFTNLSRTATHEQNLKMLQLNRVQALFYEPLGMAYLCKKLGLSLSDFEPILRTITSDVYLMMSKKNTSLTLVDKWLKASKAIKEDGTFQEIIKHWSSKIKRDTDLSYGYKDGALGFLK